MTRGVWLVSARFDLAVFALPAAVALLLVALAPQLAPTGETPLPFWVITIVLVDVAHVWSTLYRTYLDRAELRRRPALYGVVPLAAYAVGVVLYAISYQIFWTVLAYLAVVHFVRQQYGWVALYNRRAGDHHRIDRAIDAAAIYAATIFPIVWWHAHLPRRFEWFLAGDFIGGVPAAIVVVLWPVYVAALAAFVLRQAWRWQRERTWRPGKITVVVTTAVCWGVGIIATNSDWAFTATNVLIHGVPYMAVVWVYGRRAAHADNTLLGWVFGGQRWLVFYLLIAALAYVEELGWDRLVWHDNPSVFFGPEITLTAALTTLLVPLLALPQATHYLLDAWIWRTNVRANPELSRALGLTRSLSGETVGR